MSELHVSPGPGIPGGLIVPSGELLERFSRSSGPGGQGVNTTDSRVQLSLDLAASSAFNDRQRERVLSRLSERLVGTTITIDASEHRSQRRNRTVARERLAEILREALAPAPPQRRATRPTRGSQRRRLAAKRRRGEIKNDRARPAADD